MARRTRTAFQSTRRRRRCARPLLSDDAAECVLLLPPNVWAAVRPRTLPGAGAGGLVLEAGVLLPGEHERRAVLQEFDARGARCAVEFVAERRAS